MALHSPKTCVYFGSSRSLFSLFWQNMIICVAFFLATMSCRVRHWRRRWRRQHCFRCSTRLHALTSSRSRAYCNFYVKTENLSFFIFGRTYIWVGLNCFLCIVRPERLTDTCVVTEFGRDGLDSHNCSHFCPNTLNASWQKFALLANPVSNDKLSRYLMQRKW